MRIRESDLEAQLRAAAADFPQPLVSETAWHHNQRRLDVGAGGGRRLRIAPRVLAVAAGVVAVILMAFAVTSGGGLLSHDAGPPASSDPFNATNRVGRAVTLEKLTLGGKPAIHRAFFTRDGEKGLSLCDQYVQDGSTAGGCTSRQPHAQDPSVAIDWLTGSANDNGNGQSLHSVLAAVDSRVNHVELWMTNGDRMVPALVGMSPDARAFAVTVTGSAPRPLRLVAYASDSHVLQALDLSHILATSGQRDAATCQTSPMTGGVWPQPETGAGGNVAVRWGTFTAVVSDQRSYRPTCVPLRNTAILGTALAARDILVVLVAPEAVLVRLEDPSGTVAEIKPAPSLGSPYGAAVFAGLSPAVTKNAYVLALDVTGQALDRTPIGPVSP